MRNGIHPDYRTVVFHDTRVNEYFKIGSTIRTERTIQLEGVGYPYVTIEISLASYPYYTGKQKVYVNEDGPAWFQQRFGHFLVGKRIKS